MLKTLVKVSCCRAVVMVLGILLLGSVTHAHAEIKKNKIAVLDFQQNGRFDTPDVGKMVAEWFTTSLVETGRFQILERRLLPELLKVLKIDKSDLIDSKTSSRAGKLLGVSMVVTGTVQSFDRRLEINVRVINLESGSIITAEKVGADSATRLTDLVKEISARIIKAFPLEGYVVKRTKERVVVGLGSQAGVKPGMQLAVYVQGELIKDPDTGELLDTEMIENGVIEIQEVKEKVAYAKISHEVAPGAIQTRHLVRVVSVPYKPPVPDPPKPVLPKPIPPVPPSPILAGSNVLNAHKDDIKVITFSDSGRYVASADSNNKIILWNTQDWQPKATLQKHRSDVKALRFSGDERYLASGSRDDTVILWDVESAKPVRIFKADNTVNAVAFSPDGTLVAAGTNSDSVFLWNVRDGSKCHVLKGKDDVFALAFSPNGEMLVAAGNNGFLQLWEVRSGALIRNFEGERRDVRAVAFENAGNVVISGSDDKKITYWDLATGSKIKVLEGHHDSVRALALSRDGSLLVSGDGRKEGGIIVWTQGNNQEGKHLNSEDDFDALAMSPDGCTLVLGCSKKLVVRRLE